MDLGRDAAAVLALIPAAGMIRVGELVREFRYWSLARFQNAVADLVRESIVSLHEGRVRRITRSGA